MTSLVCMIVKNPKVSGLISKLLGFSLRKCSRYSTQLVLLCGDRFGSFIDAEGKCHDLFKCLRNVLKPDWQQMFSVESTVKPMSAAEASARLNKYRLRVEALVNFLALSSLTLKGRQILEIGAGDGATAYALAECGPQRVVASDIAKYYLHQEPGSSLSDDAIASKNDDLRRMRNSFEAVYRKSKTDTGVLFVEDDMTRTVLDSDSFDYVFSWEVLEHFAEPREAFRGMAKVLKSGGYAFHEYNPFFSLMGGHSLCTLDFLWGHARISTEDFYRYLFEFRPEEMAVAKSFFVENLNRMCLADLHDYAQGAGLEIIDVIPFVSDVDCSLLTGEIILDAKRFYPNVSYQDFVSPKVWLFMRKK